MLTVLAVYGLVPEFLFIASTMFRKSQQSSEGFASITIIQPVSYNS